LFAITVLLSKITSCYDFAEDELAVVFAGIPLSSSSSEEEEVGSLLPDN